jgi:hypothetical protein
MLWDPQPPLQKPVLQLTAEKMGLRYWPREPFRFDGAFVAERHRVVGGSYPVPMIVVFEHEDKFQGFEAEIVKLGHIRCPLKVGITYTPVAIRDTVERKLVEWVREIRRELNEIGTEDHKFEYVYMLGVERELYMLDWYHLTFGGPTEPQAFCPLPQLLER